LEIRKISLATIHHACGQAIKEYMEKHPGYDCNLFRRVTEPLRELIIGTIIKPCAGLSSEEVAEKCYQAAEAAWQNISLRDYAHDHRELRVAIVEMGD